MDQSTGFSSMPSPHIYFPYFLPINISKQQSSFEEVLESKIKPLHSQIERLTGKIELKASKAHKQEYVNTMSLLVRPLCQGDTASKHDSNRHQNLMAILK
jgi:hypothetical protein